MVNQTYLPIFPFATLPTLLLKGRRPICSHPERSEAESRGSVAAAPDGGSAVALLGVCPHKSGSPSRKLPCRHLK